jgi:hypothetical protein
MVSFYYILFFFQILFVFVFMVKKINFSGHFYTKQKEE